MMQLGHKECLCLWSSVHGQLAACKDTLGGIYIRFMDCDEIIFPLRYIGIF